MVDETNNEIVEYTTENKAVKAKELAELVGISERQAEYVKAEYVKHQEKVKFFPRCRVCRHPEHQEYGVRS